MRWVALVVALWTASPARADEPMSMAEHPHAMQAGSLGLSHAREASGTSWQPDATPLRMHHFIVSDWMLMVHYQLEGTFDDQYGPRGGSTLMSTNWVMGAAQHELLGGIFRARAMLSLEPLTVPAEGYPLLLQTGEAYHGQTLHDVQHPHDLFMELSLGYSREVAHGVAAQLYVAPVGEPALGPTAFPHRESAAAFPLATLTHHFFDSTHVSYGVVTAAVFTRKLKLDASAFNGHEPNDERWGLDPIALNSWSGRVQLAPCRGFVGQVSYGHLDSPEAAHPGEDQHRVTASGTMDLRFGEAGNWATTAGWAAKREGGTWANAAFVETNVDTDGTNTVFARFEWVQRTPDDLDVSGALPSKLPVAEATVGYLFETDPLGPVRAGLGIAGMLAFMPDALEVPYGSTAQPGLSIFLRLRPADGT